MRPIRKTTTRSAILGLILSVAVVVCARTNVGTFYIVDGESMCPTLYPGDVVRAKVSFVKVRGDVVILTDGGGSEAVKRIVGLPGERVTLFGGEVYVNGRQLWEPYLAPTTRTLKNNQKNEPPAVWHLAADEYFVMGDNRYESGDSRLYGPIRRTAIHGVVGLPSNALLPILLETSRVEPGKAAHARLTGRTAQDPHSLLARRSFRAGLRFPSDSVVR